MSRFQVAYIYINFLHKNLGDFSFVSSPSYSTYSFFVWGTATELSELAPLTHPQTHMRGLPSPFVSKEAWGEPIRTKGQTLWYSRPRIIPLWAQHSPQYFLTYTVCTLYVTIYREHQYQAPAFQWLNYLQKNICCGKTSVWENLHYLSKHI